ncbi:hypothetical protein M413DRAFT_438522 [Hebeloma cylindrosporum]|uniref:Uncharacterized protein n=1 Tax=Hebeloma cylindrosporum TaxID=76867 RepID=A0A0C2YHS1_HEBCY|nr:hypothetical protein M413DRAFT_438522 [Hebeloma cylindrosporum h7]
MASFPRDERNEKPPSTKRKDLAQEWNRDHPNVEQGLIGAATLSEDKNRCLNWVYAAQPSCYQNDVFRKRLAYGKQIEVFPSTCPLPWNTEPTSIQQRAEQGANFLRTYLPDVEIAEEIIRDQLVEDTTLSRAYEIFDPYLGNVLSSFEPQSANDSAFLIFPTGETNRDLRKSLTYAEVSTEQLILSDHTYVSYADPHDILFKPLSEPFYKFLTPVRQVLVSSDAVLAVRTFSSTHVLRLKQLEESATLRATPLYAITREDMENEIAVDIRHLPSSNVILAVGDGGTVFACDPMNGAKEISLLHRDIDQAFPPKEAHFQRLALDTGHSNYFLLSSRKVQHLDMRMQSVNELHSISPGRHVFTSLEDCHRGHIVRLCSTNRVIWMDTRFPRKPLLAYGHGREYDRYLSTHTFDCGLYNPITTLTSRDNSLITVYDVSQPIDDFIQLNTLPYPLSPACSIYRKPTGLHILNFKQSLGLACLSEREGLSYIELLLTGSQGDKTITVETSKDMQMMAARNVDRRPDIGPLGIQEFSVVDLQGAYESLFRKHFKERKEFEEASAESVYEVLDYFPSYFQIQELPTEYILTMSDVILRGGDEPDHTTRADFLTESIVNSKRGFRALKQGRLAPSLVNAPWKKSILPALLKLDPEYQADHQCWMESLQNFNLSDPGERSDWSREFEQESCQQLVMDLVLSSDIYSDLTFAKPGEIYQTLETMTEALSLGNEPPHVEFGHFKPVKRKFTDDEIQESASEGLDLPIGVRLLLGAWDDSEVEDYVYRDPYHIVNQTSALMKSAPPSHHDLGIQSHRPPAILASNTHIKRLPNILQRSQGNFLSNNDPAIHSLPLSMSELRSSQELVVSTQVLPGPHGGRPMMNKKPAKKRLGGF